MNFTVRVQYSNCLLIASYYNDSEHSSIEQCEFWGVFSFEISIFIIFITYLLYFEFSKKFKSERNSAEKYELEDSYKFLFILSNKKLKIGYKKGCSNTVNIWFVRY